MIYWGLSGFAFMETHWCNLVLFVFDVKPSSRLTAQGSRVVCGRDGWSKRRVGGRTDGWQLSLIFRYATGLYTEPPSESAGCRWRSVETAGRDVSGQRFVPPLPESPLATRLRHCRPSRQPTDMDFARLWRCFFGALLVAATLATAQDDDDSLASSFFSGQFIELLVYEFVYSSSANFKFGELDSSGGVNFSANCWVTKNKTIATQIDNNCH